MLNFVFFPLNHFLPIFLLLELEVLLLTFVSFVHLNSLFEDGDDGDNGKLLGTAQRPVV